jgi:hypothetical protein
MFFRDGIALRVGQFKNPVTGEIVEHNGVLCHPVLADFVLTRMAREASLVEGLPSITFGGTNYTDHLFDGSRPQRVDSFRLLQSTMDLLVPNNIGQCDIREFMKIRDEYREIRQSIWRYFEEITNDMNLDLDIFNIELLTDRLAQARGRVESELEDVKLQIGRDRFSSGAIFAFETAATVASAALGAHFGGPFAAAAAASAGIVFSRGASKMSTFRRNRDGTAHSIAMSLAKIEKRRFPPRRTMSNYFL